MIPFRLRSAALKLLITLAAASSALRADAPIALINGNPINREELIAALIEARGLEMMQQLIVLELAEAEAQRRNIRITEGDVDRELDDALERMLPGSRGKLSDDQRLEALQRVLNDRCLSMHEFRIALRRNAYLRRLITTDVQITESTMREQYARKYGEKVEVRHIQIGIRNNNQLLAAIDGIARGTDFTKLVREYSENPESRGRDGLMEPFTFADATIPEAIRQAAFDLPAGQTSPNPIRAGEFHHIIRVERRIPSTTPFEAVKAEVEQDLRREAETRRMNEYVNQLYDQARAGGQIRILDAALRGKHEQFEKQRAAGAPNNLP